MSTVDVPPTSTLPVAQYLRASSEHQQFSTTNQRQALALYATANGFQVVQTYIDEAKSGLVLKHRPGLQQLLRDVVSDSVPYKAILVYDVSRWGRFLDSDESAHYEFVCKSSGVPVHYCAEVFGNDSSMPNLIMKAVKRSMAGEYSRELSAKVACGLERLVRNGFRSGSVPGYGLRRLLLAADGSRKQQLKLHERKSLASDRVVYELGPPDEVQCVRDIYKMFIEKRMNYVSIARTLNEVGVPTVCKNGRWTHVAVRTILSHAKYTGALVYNRTTQRLQGPTHNLPKSEWIIVPDVFEAIVDQTTYERAQAIRFDQIWNRSDADLLDRLRVVLRKCGRLSSDILMQNLEAPSATTCRTRFGSLMKAYELIGYRPRIAATVELRTRLRSLRKRLIDDLAALFPKELTLVDHGKQLRTYLRHRTGLKVCVRACRSIVRQQGGARWVVEPYIKENRWITLLALLNSNNTKFEKFVLLSGIPFRGKVTVGLKDGLVKSGSKLTDLRRFLNVLDEMRIRRRTKLRA